jgi:hypothetical protein
MVDKREGDASTILSTYSYSSSQQQILQIHAHWLMIASAFSHEQQSSLPVS